MFGEKAGIEIKLLIYKYFMAELETTLIKSQQGFQMNADSSIQNVIKTRSKPIKIEVRLFLAYY